MDVRYKRKPLIFFFLMYAWDYNEHSGFTLTASKNSMTQIYWNVVLDTFQHNVPFSPPGPLILQLLISVGFEDKCVWVFVKQQQSGQEGGVGRPDWSKLRFQLCHLL